MSVESLKSKTSEEAQGASEWENLGSEVIFKEKAPKTLPELPRRSRNTMCDFYLREIEHQGDMETIKSFLESAIDAEYREFASEDKLAQFCREYSEKLSDFLSEEDKAALKNYSGFGYKYINQVARGQWNYEILGRKTPENFASTQRNIEKTSHAIIDAPNLGTNIVAHRGTNLDSFQSYGVHSISQLTELENQFFLETGFTSTSLSRESSFAGRKQFDDPLRRACNITVEYLISADNDDVAGLFSHETSYNPEQREVLVDNSSLSYVSKVEISPDQSEAKMQMVLIPRGLYEHPPQEDLA